MFPLLSLLLSMVPGQYVPSMPTMPVGGEFLTGGVGALVGGVVGGLVAGLRSVRKTWDHEMSDAIRDHVDGCPARHRP